MGNLDNFNAEQYNFQPNDFELAQDNVVIHDTKFETKTTTFAKDAFKRFCKNKSSVVAAILIGILIVLAIFVPLVSPHNITKPDPQLTMLKPKLFEAGTGFWDGTEAFTNISWNALTESPEGFNKHAVVKYTEIKEGEVTDTPHINAMGGYLRFQVKELKSPASDRYKETKYINNYHTFKVTADGDYEVAIKLGNEDFKEE